MKKILNIATTYPVKWSDEQVMSNFLQNFYDATGFEHFASDFHYHYINEILLMKSASGFSLDWLCYMGTSTKRNNDGTGYAGGFGEGFKVAALVAVRDMHLAVSMESRDWTLAVTLEEGEIAGTPVNFLAYDIGDRPYEDTSILALYPVNPDLLHLFEKVRDSFFYEENPCFDRCIVSCPEYAIYTTKKEAKNSRAQGMLYAHYQRREFLKVPLAICNHIYQRAGDDRDRTSFFSTDCEQCIREVFDRLSPAVALDVLESIRCKWARPNYRDEIRWGRLIIILIDKIRLDTQLIEIFKSKYADTLIARDSGKSFFVYIWSQNDRIIATEWFRSYKNRTVLKLVDHVFWSLGIKTICDLCHENGGFNVDREPNEYESACLEILKIAAGELLTGIICLQEWPSCRILTNRKAPVRGYTLVQSEQKGMKNAYGLKVVASADHVYLQSYLFRPDGFYSAFSTYAHELLHQFGGDNSRQFHQALVLLDQQVLADLKMLAACEKTWRTFEPKPDTFCERKVTDTWGKNS